MNLLDMSNSNAIKKTVEDNIQKQQELNLEISSKLSSNNQNAIKLNLPELHNLENSSETFVENHDNNIEINNKDLIINNELAEEYDKIKNSYDNIVNMIERSIENDRQLHNSKHMKIKDYGFKKLEDFQKSVEQGEFNINDYNISEINVLIRELDNLENKAITKPLHNYNLKTINDFQKLVDDGSLNLSNYEIEEITELLKGLEDKSSLSLKDHSINLEYKHEVESTKDQGMIVNNSEIEKGFLFRLTNKIKKYLNSL